MNAMIREAAAKLLLSQHLTSFYACGMMDLRRFRGNFIIDTYSAFLARGKAYMPPLFSGSLPNGVTLRSPDLPGYGLIFYDESLSPERRNFTIAHELGHLTLEHLQADSYVAADARQERQADAFAAALLMPPILILTFEQLRNRPMTAAEIAKYFAVSRSAAIRQRAEIDRARAHAHKRASVLSYSPAERNLALRMFEPMLGRAEGEGAMAFPDGGSVPFNRRYGY